MTAGAEPVGPAWAVCVNEWDGAEYHETIVGPFATEDEAEEWANSWDDPTTVFDLLPPSEWRSGMVLDAID